VPLGEIGVLDYAGQFGLPNAAHTAATEAPAALAASDPRAYLPPAPAGWTRRHWSAGDNTWVHKDRRLGDTGVKTDGTMLENGLDAFMDHRDVYAQRRALGAGWIYERGDEIIYIGAERLETGSSNSLIGRGLTKVDRALNRMNFREGYAVVHGVPYAETMHSAEAKRLFRSFEGRIGYGQEIRVKVRSHATTASVNALLEQIDHSGLNALLDAPVAGIGPDAPRLPSEVGAMLAGYTFEVRDALQDLTPRDVADVLRQGRPLHIAIEGLGGEMLDGQRLSQVSQ
jgi:hypothetical protein